MIICLEQGANDLHIVQLMPLPPHHLWLTKIQIHVAFLVAAYPGCSHKGIAVRYSLHFALSRRQRKMYCGHERLCVCLSAAVCPHYCTEPDVTWGHGRGCPLVVHYWADLQSGHGLRCYGNITRTLGTSFRPSRNMPT